MPSILQTFASFFTGSNSRDGPITTAGPSSRRRTTLSSTKDAFSLPTHSPTMDTVQSSRSMNEVSSSSAPFSYPPTSPTTPYDYVPNTDYATQHLSPIPGSSNRQMDKNSSPILPMHSDPNSVHPSSLHGYPALHHTWARLRAWLANEYMELGDTLNYGIQPSVISSVEMELGLPLPSAVRDSYLICDGQEVESSAGCSEGLFFGLTLLPLEDVLEEWRFWREVDEDPNTGANEHLRSVMKSIPDNHVRREYSCRGWLPLVTDRAGNYLGVDLHPADQGTYGQVIVFGRDFDTKVVMWRGEGEGGWGRWLSGLVDELENGDGFEMTGSGDGSSGSEDELGYDGYFYSPNGVGRGEGTDGASGGLRLTGEYKGWNVLEAWADRSVRRWIQAGVYKEEEEAEPVPGPEIEITAASATTDPESSRETPTTTSADNELQLQSSSGPLPIDDTSATSTPTTTHPAPSSIVDRHHQQQSSASPAVPPIPKPVPLPTVRDLLSGTSPTSSLPNSPRLSEDDANSQQQRLNSAPTTQLRSGHAAFASENPSLVDVDQATRPLVGTESPFSHMRREDSMKSMASVELMAPPRSASAAEEEEDSVDAVQNATPTVTSTTPVTNPTSSAQIISVPGLATPIRHEIELVTPTAQSFALSTFADTYDARSAPPPVPSKGAPTPDAVSMTSGVVTPNGVVAAETNGTNSAQAPSKPTSRLVMGAKSTSPAAVASPTKVPLPAEELTSPSRTTTSTPPLPDSRPGTPNSIGSSSSKRPSKVLHNKSTKSITNFFTKDKEGGKERERTSSIKSSVSDVDAKEKEKTKRGSTFGSPFKGLMSVGGKKKEKEKEDTVV